MKVIEPTQASTVDRILEIMGKDTEKYEKYLLQARINGILDGIRRLYTQLQGRIDQYNKQFNNSGENK